MEKLSEGKPPDTYFIDGWRFILPICATLLAESLPNIRRQPRKDVLTSILELLLLLSTDEASQSHYLCSVHESGETPPFSKSGCEK